MGGFICARREVVALLRERARPYLFSNALAPSVCGAAIAAIDLAQGHEGEALRATLHSNSVQFRSGLLEAGFNLLNGGHPIIPVMIGDAGKASQFATTLLEHGVYARAFSYPVVPRGQARIRTQMSAALNSNQITEAISAFRHAGQSIGVIS